MRLLTLIPILLFLAACGGGGGGGGSVSALTSADYETAEYSNQYGLGQIKASSIYADGYSGSSVKVAVIDTGVDLDHPDLVDNIASGGYDYVDDDADANPNGQGDYMSHGTHVAGIIAGMKNDTGMHGVAYNAEILALRAGTSAGVIGYIAVENSIDRAISQGAKVINASYGGSSILTRTANKYLSAHNNDIITVAAAGNDGNSNPDYPAMLPSEAGYTALQETLIAVVATDSNNTIASFSNQCGAAKNWCMAAPGASIYSTVDTTDNTDANSDGYDSYNGTSMATPHVSGAAAILRSKWPSKTNAQIVDVLFDTATDLGDSGVDAVYGHGLLNLQNAMSAQGTLSLKTSSGDSYSLSDSGMALSAITGNINSLNLRTAVYDKFDRDFYTKINALINDNNSNDLNKELNFKPTNLSASEKGVLYGINKHSRFVKSNMDGYQLMYSNGSQVSQSLSLSKDLSQEFTNNYLDNSNAFLNQMVNAHTINMGSTLDGTKASIGLVSGYVDPEEEHPISGLNMSLLSDLAEDLILETQISSMVEKDTFLSNYFSGAYKTGSSKTNSININANYQISNNLSINAQYTKGRTSVETVGGSIIQEMSDINTSGYAFSIKKNSVNSENDSLIFQYKQSLGVDDGSMKLMSASGLNADDTTRFSEQHISLTNHKKETRISLGYGNNFKGNSKLVGLISYISNPNHDSNALDEKQVMLKWSRSF